MNDVYEQQLAHELEIHARTEAPDAGLVDRLLARAAVRRRRRRTVLVSVTAVVAVALALGVGAGSVLYQSNRKTPPAKDHRTSTTAALHIAYAVNGTKAANGTWSRTVVQLPPPGSVRVTLPDHWSVERLERSGPGYVLLVRVVPASKFAEFTAYIGPDGSVRQLQHLDHSAIPLTADGTTWVSANPSLHVVNGLPEASGVELVQPATDTVVGTQSGIPGARMVAAVNENSVMVQDNVGQVRIWPLTGEPKPGPKVDIHGTPWFLMGVAADGRILLRAPRQLHLLDSTGRELWTWDRPGGMRWDYAAANLSPTGRYAAARFTDGYAVLDTQTGATVGGGVHAGLLAVVWEDARTLVVTQGQIGGPLQRCDVVTDRCSALKLPGVQTLTLPSNDVVFAGS